MKQTTIHGKICQTLKDGGHPLRLKTHVSSALTNNTRHTQKDQDCHFMPIVCVYYTQCLGELVQEIPYTCSTFVPMRMVR